MIVVMFAVHSRVKLETVRRGETVDGSDLGLVHELELCLPRVVVGKEVVYRSIDSQCMLRERRLSQGPSHPCSLCCCRPSQVP